jgi:hypothetical protein
MEEKTIINQIKEYCNDDYSKAKVEEALAALFVPGGLPMRVCEIDESGFTAKYDKKEHLKAIRSVFDINGFIKILKDGNYGN